MSLPTFRSRETDDSDFNNIMGEENHVVNNRLETRMMIILSFPLPIFCLVIHSPTQENEWRVMNDESIVADLLFPLRVISCFDDMFSHFLKGTITDRKEMSTFSLVTEVRHVISGLL